MSRRSRVVLLLVVVFGLVFAQSVAAQKRILVIETTDIHGWIIDASSGDERTFLYNFADIAYRVDQLRASEEYDDVLLLDGGDLFQGTPVSTMTGGAVVRAVLDRMKYDTIGLGNHEFDWDVTDYAADQEGTIAPYVLGDYFGDAKTPILASNLYDAASQKRVPFTRDYAVIEKAGLRIAVVGYIPDYRNDILAEKIAPYEIDSDLSHLNELICKINKAEQPDITIVLAHEDPVTVAKGLDPQEVDLVAGGHTHEVTAKRAPNGIPCIQGDHFGTGFASAVITVDPEGRVEVDDLEFTNILENKELLYDTGENASHLDPEILAVSHAAWFVLQEEMGEVLGYIDTPIVKSDGIGSSSAGNWLSGLMLRAMKDDGAVMAFLNAHGVRTELTIPEGRTARDVTVYDVYNIAPFANRLLLYDLNAQELAEHLVNGLKDSNYGDQMSGLTFTYSVTKDAKKRKNREYEILSITLDDGTQVDLNDTETLYRICTIGYCAQMPGSVFEDKVPAVPAADAPADNETYIKQLRKEGSENNGYIPVDTGVRGVEIPLPDEKDWHMDAG